MYLKRTVNIIEEKLGICLAFFIWRLNRFSNIDNTYKKKYFYDSYRSFTFSEATYCLRRALAIWLTAREHFLTPDGGSRASRVLKPFLCLE